MKLSWRFELAQLIIIAAMFAVAGWAWPQVPDRLPVHWNIHGEVDGWGGKFTGLLLLPIVALGTYLLTVILPLFDPGRRNYESFKRAFGVIRLATVLFLSLIYAVGVLAAFGHPINMTTVVFPAVGVLFIVIGNFMSKIRPNWFVGVRTPWTLSSRLSWDKTHRLAGWLFIVMGLLFVLLTFAANGWMLVAVLAIDAICILWMIVYSYVVYRQDPHPLPPAGVTANPE